MKERKNLFMYIFLAHGKVNLLAFKTLRFEKSRAELENNNISIFYFSQCGITTVKVFIAGVSLDTRLSFLPIFMTIRFILIYVLYQSFY